MTHRLPALFIGSSVEGLDVAHSIQHGLEYDTEPTVWNQSVFSPGTFPLQELVKDLGKFDFAVFVFSADDSLKLRGQDFKTVRDNVVFELGLFMGALGPDRCFCLKPRYETSLHLPSDLAGIIPLTYNNTRSDGNLVAAVGPACTEIRNVIRRHIQDAATQPVFGRKSGGLIPESPQAKLNRMRHIWNGETMRVDRELLRKQGVPASPYEVDRENRDSWNAFNRVFYFLEALCAAILAGEIDMDSAKPEFGESVKSVWTVGKTALTVPNHTVEAWDPLPSIAQVATLWAQ